MRLWCVCLFWRGLRYNSQVENAQVVERVACVSISGSCRATAWNFLFHYLLQLFGVASCVELLELELEFSMTTG
jgi:hypothetical protein